MSQYFTQRRPYRYDAFMDGTSSADLIGEYYCKKLAGKNADHAGSQPFPGTIYRRIERTGSCVIFRLSTCRAREEKD
jgi:hypothetical protein